MKNLKLLDCSLRDGMYAIDFDIDDTIKNPVIVGLENAGVDIIECGFLKAGEMKQNSPNYRSPHDITQYITPKKRDVLYIAMAANAFDIKNDDIPAQSENMIDGIRIVLTRDSIDYGVELGRQLISKGYKILFQIANTKQYTEQELQDMLIKIDGIEPYAVSIVDTNGNTPPSVIIKLLSEFESTLSPNVGIDFHFHNNMQFAMANAIAVIEQLQANREYILDSSIFGIGQGAGNLPTELIMTYLNEKYAMSYNPDEAMRIFGQYFQPYYKKTPWGYNLSHLIAARLDCHAFYARYFFGKLDINHSQLMTLLKQIPERDQTNFNGATANKIIENFLVSGEK